MTRSPAARVALDFQREWFASLHARPVDSPLVLAGADIPHEILRVLGLPYVINQWWASIISAKRLAEASSAELQRAGYPDDDRPYDALPLGAMSLPAEQAPWGGLPVPSLVVAEASGTMRKLVDLWGTNPGTQTYLFERTASTGPADRWWERIATEWDDVLGADRIDLMVAEISELVEIAERQSGRRFDLVALSEVMRLGNEQAEFNRRTRDLLARTRPLPVALADLIPAVMIPQWHRGSVWARDAAERLFEEVSAACDRGDSVAAREEVRLMWIGRGVWGDLDFYRRFEQSDGAVFVWSMYLAIAADGYARYGPDPMRALAARFVGLTDLLYAPPYAGAWYVKEALSHGIDGVVHLAADDVLGSRFLTEALEAAGIPVLELRGSNTDPRVSGDALDARIRGFIADRVR